LLSTDSDGRISNARFQTIIVMAGFRTHISLSSAAGIVYGIAGYQSGMPLETCVLGGGLCSVCGMLPDLDSDSGIPLREATLLSAALVPMLMVERLERFGLSHEMMVLATVGIYFFIRFVVAEVFRRYTVHRGMWHSIPAAAVVGMLAFLICGCEDISGRLFKTFAVVLGFLSHLLLDEMWSVEFKRGGYQFKSSFGTALKFWGRSNLANSMAYLKVLVLAVLVYNDERVMDYFGHVSSDVPHTAVQLLNTVLEKSESWVR
jgi:membrane-bound metal-dependent hydrolase YbcI (DUF457 family)